MFRGPSNKHNAFSAQKVYHVIEGRSIPDWKKFLCNPENKQSLLKLHGEYCIRYLEQSPLVVVKALYLAGAYHNPEVVKRFSSDGISNCVELYSTQEKADTRIILHSLFADKQFGYNGVKGRIVVQSSDTDVLLLCLHYYPQMVNTEEIWFQTRAVSNIKDGRRFFPVHKLYRSTGVSVCSLLPAVHALTGCDSTSSFFGIGKKSVYKLLLSKPEQFLSLTSLSAGDQESAIDGGRKFVASLYDPKGKFKDSHCDLNKLQVKLATVRSVNVVRLPPCDASFIQHIIQAMLQTNVWMNSHIAKPVIRSPLGFGWEECRNTLLPLLFEGPMSSYFLQDLVCTCKDKTSCSTNCVCNQQHLACTPICACEGSDRCKNSLTQEAISDEDHDDDDS